MVRSLIVFVSFVCFALPSAQAGHQDAIEPNQVIDIRMEDGLKSAGVTEHVAADANGPLLSAGFLDNHDRKTLDKVVSALEMQNADMAAVSNMLEQIHNE